MESKLVKLVGATAIGASVLLSAPAVPQTSGSDSSGARSSTGATDQRRDGDKRDWGWLGLLGLVGLAGLRRNRDDNYRAR